MNENAKAMKKELQRLTDKLRKLSEQEFELSRSISGMKYISKKLFDVWVNESGKRDDIDDDAVRAICGEILKLSLIDVFSSKMAASHAAYDWIFSDAAIKTIKCKKGTYRLPFTNICEILSRQPRLIRGAVDYARGNKWKPRQLLDFVSMCEHHRIESYNLRLLAMMDKTSSSFQQAMDVVQLPRDVFEAALNRAEHELEAGGEA